jgi:hypothetical protein
MFCDGGICSAQRNWETKHPAQSDSLKPRGCYLADQLERNDPPAIDSGIQDCLHLRCVQAITMLASKLCSVAIWKHFNLHGEFDFSDERIVDSIALAVPKNLDWKLD